MCSILSSTTSAGLSSNFCASASVFYRQSKVRGDASYIANGLALETCQVLEEDFEVFGGDALQIVQVFEQPHLARFVELPRSLLSLAPLD